MKMITKIYHRIFGYKCDCCKRHVPATYGKINIAGTQVRTCYSCNITQARLDGPLKEMYGKLLNKIM